MCARDVETVSWTALLSTRRLGGGDVGADAIQEFFRRRRDTAWFESFGRSEQRDLLEFEGNAVALRLATRRAGPLSPCGLDLTCATLGALVKYPCASIDAQGRDAERKS